jgi:protein-arginine kinase activator protein McsA
LKKGEFDDYITQEGLDTAKAAGVENQKELRVIKLAEEIENKSKTLETLFDSEEFEQIMRDILNVDL